MTSTSNVIHSDPDVLGGTPVFFGTRVPVKTLLDYLEAGDLLDEFLDHFPSVSRKQAIAVLELALINVNWFTKLYLAINLVRLDERTGNVFFLAGEENIIEIYPNGRWRYVG